MLTKLHVSFALAVCATAQVGASAWAQPVARSQTATGKVVATPVQRVAVVRMTYAGDVPKGHQDSFEARLVEGLAVAAFQVLSGPPVERTLSGAKLARCADGACYPKVAEALDVGYLLVGQVEESNKNYDITLELINGRTGATIGATRERCETCGVAEAAERVALASVALRARLEALAATPAHVVVQSRPGGAAASVNGKPVGRTPVDLELPGGQHRLGLELEGYNKAERHFTVVSGVDETINVDLLRPPSQFPYKAVGWVAVVGGAALVAAGGYAVSLDGKVIACDDSEKDINGLCPRLRDTDLIATALVGVGAATAALGGVSLWVASQQAPAPADTVAARIPRGVGVRWAGRF